MSPEVSKQPWLSPFKFDGSVAGAYVRSTEVLAFNLVMAMAVGDNSCIMGALGFGSLLIMAGQFAACEKHPSEDALPPWQKWRRR